MYRQQRSRFHTAAECLPVTTCHWQVRWRRCLSSQNLFGRGSKYLIKCMNSFIPFRGAFQLYQEYRALFGTDNGVFRNICNKIGERNTLIKCACWLNFMFDKNFILRQLWKSVSVWHFHWRANLDFGSSLILLKALPCHSG